MCADDMPQLPDADTLWVVEPPKRAVAQILLISVFLLKISSVKKIHKNVTRDALWIDTVKL